MTDTIMVSVICNAYNHEKYIRDALEGLVTQKTDFAFEVLVHDDASTDHTADIIREYEKKYPDIIKPIYQKVNQYSQKKSIGVNFQYPRIRGKYVAVCEGDDYWTDTYKLQKQYDLMEAHPEIDLCAHGYKVLNMQNNEIKDVRLFDHITVISAKDVIKIGGQGLATASLFYRAEMNKNVPEFRRIQNMDYTIQIQGALRGGVLYLPDMMCVYRSCVDSSWTDRMRKNPEKKIVHKKKRIVMLRQLNKDTNGEYKWIIWKIQLLERIKIILLKSGICR